MPRTRSEGNGSLETAAERTEAVESESPDQANQVNSDVVATVATVAVVGIGAAAFEAALLPGIVLGVAAMWVPQYFPKMGETLNPLFRSTIRGCYKLSHKTREMMAEAQEQFHDIAAEVHAENESDDSKTAAAA